MTNSINFQDFQDELLSTTRESIELSKEYLKCRKIKSHCFNQLQVLIYKANLHTSKKSIENKISELLSHNEYGKEAQELNKKMLEDESEYKGLELVVKSYQIHATALMSVIKQQTNGEITTAMQAKYNLQR